jgi:hypothetical protein
MKIQLLLIFYQIIFKKITKISAICELLNIQPVGKTMFYEYSKLLSLYLTIPVTRATAKRSFSVMNRIKHIYAVQ